MTDTPKRPDAPAHNYWMAGEPDCPREIKASNGELHTLRCKLCGLDDPRDAICYATPQGRLIKAAPDLLEVAQLFVAVMDEKLFDAKSLMDAAEDARAAIAKTTGADQ